MTEHTRLSPEQLYHLCDLSQVSFKTTEDLAPVTDMVGQQRAVEAVGFGTAMQRPGYNLFVMGPAGVGKHTYVTQYLKQKAAALPTPDDCCYVYNFEVPHQPRALQLPAGRGVALQQDMVHFVEELHSDIPAAFETDQFHNRIKSIDEETKEQEEQALLDLQAYAKERNVDLIRTHNGFVFAPLYKGAVLDPEGFSKLPQNEQERIEAIVKDLQDRLEQVLRSVQQNRKAARDRVKALKEEVTRFATGHLIDELKNRYQDLPQVLTYLDAVREDVVANGEEFRQSGESGMPLLNGGGGHSAFLRRYKVNLIVDNSQLKGAPVVYEDHPTFQNLIGNIEHIAQMGALVTDFTLIKPGALHRANGGYLLLDAHRLLTLPFAWEELKRTLRAGKIKIEPLGQMLSLVSTVTLQPEPIPIETKIVVLGERILYYLLNEYDPEFAELFKVMVDFEDQMNHDPENRALYARMVATLAQKEKLLPFNREGVARVIEHSMRLVDDQRKLSTNMRNVCDLMCEAEHWAREAGGSQVDRQHVQQAIDSKYQRASRYQERVLEDMMRDILFIDTGGEAVGQINGLSVIDIGGLAFGQPSRITASVRMGEGEVVDIEREVDLGGSIHSKGVFTLQAFVGARFTRQRPLSLSASLVFEQSYGMIDGDSASMAELCALLSAIGQVPLKQSLAITGSINQHGVVQPIGGVNEKIEGFFHLCQARGLTGDQGVIIPRSNVEHLMLRPEVVAAVKQGQFHVYAVSDIDEALELLSGIPAGAMSSRGGFPRGTFNHRVDQRLKKMGELRQQFHDGKEGKEKHEGHS